MWVLVALVLLGTALGFLGDVWWVFDLFAHFRMHYVLVLLGVVGVAGVRWRGWLTGSAVSALAVNLRVLQYNVLTSNRQKTPLLQWVAKQDADLIVLQEVNAAWIAAAESAPGD